MPIDSRALVRRNSRVVYRPLGGEEGAVVLHLDTAAYFGLNEVGSLIWSLVGDDGASVAQLRDGVRAEVDSPPPSLDDDVDRFVGDLVERDLLQLSEPE